jgi:hypothetical protein
MEFETSFEKAVETIVRKNIPLFLTEGEVTSVSKESNTCNVDRGDLPELLDVRLESILEAGDDVFTIYPKKGSKVLCVLVENSLTDAYVLAANDIDEIKGKIGTTEFLINAEGFKIQRGTNNFKDLLNQFIAEVQAIIVIQGTSPNVVKLEEIKTKINQVLK